MTASLLIAQNDQLQLVLLPQMANRHGLITGATGTGKTGDPAITGGIVFPHRCAGVPVPTSRATCPAWPKKAEAMPRCKRVSNSCIWMISRTAPIR